MVRPRQHAIAIGVVAAVLIAIQAASDAKEPAGMASYYGSWHAGRTMANGCGFNPARFTAASRTLPLGVQARVRNLRNGLSVIVTITDRGPYVRGRILDLSQGAARVIGAEQAGVVPVSIQVLGRPKRPYRYRHCR